MSVDDIRKLVKAVPFVPFSIHMADGRDIPVYDRDWILLPPTAGRIIIVYQRDDSYDHLDVMHMTGTRFGPPASPVPQSQPSTP